LTATFALSSAARADLVFKDDTGQEIRLKAPGQRIVTLAPHAAESLYAAGAGDKLVGTVDYSDYPPEAKKGAARRRLFAHRPGSRRRAQAGPRAGLGKRQQHGAGRQAESARPDGLCLAAEHHGNVADQLERLGQLAGTEAVANAAAERFRQRLEACAKPMPASRRCASSTRSGKRR
jgi:iron complex transport system substrate-binding protein